MDNVNSSAQSINIGVPQGSILDPLLFLIYINDLPNAISSKLRLFADETCIMLSNSLLQHRLWKRTRVLVFRFVYHMFFFHRI